MRLAWWRPAPGMVRVRQRQLIQLQSAALRAGEIEAETASLRRESAAIAAEGRAAACLDSWGLEAPRDLLDDLPTRADGTLHEPAFDALVAARVWHDREVALARLMCADEGGQR